MNPSLLPSFIFLSIFSFSFILLFCLMGKVQSKPGVFNVFLVINTTFLNRNNKSGCFLLCLAAYLDGVPRGEDAVRANVVLHLCLTFTLLQI